LRYKARGKESGFMPEKRPDPSEVADSIQHLNGRIDAVLDLVSLLVATISPALASV